MQSTWVICYNFDYFAQVFDGISNKDSQIAMLCGTELPCAILSSGNKILVTFTSDYYTGSSSFGFEAVFTFLDNSTTAYEGEKLL